MENQEIPIINPEEQPNEDYIINCTYPVRGRNISQKPESADYKRCDEKKFYVKFNPRTQIARVLCSKCLRQLFEYKLNQVEVQSNGNGNPDNNSGDRTNNPDDSPNNNNLLGNQNDSKTN